jgi:hypothetical protein
MKRRKFLGMLGLAPAVVAAAPLLKALTPAPTYYRTYIMGKDAFISFTPAELEVIDPIIAKCAEELGYRASVTMDMFVMQATGKNEFAHA